MSKRPTAKNSPQDERSGRPAEEQGSERDVPLVHVCISSGKVIFNRIEEHWRSEVVKVNDGN